MIRDRLPAWSSADEHTTPEDAVDELFGALSNAHRRDVLTTVAALEDGEHATLSDLAETIAADKHGVSVRDLSGQQRKVVYVGLYQCHLPKLENCGFIELGDRTHKVWPTSRTETATAALDAVESSLADPGTLGRVKRVVTRRQPLQADLTVDDVIDALDSSRRRDVVRTVADLATGYDEPTEMRTLTNLVATEEQDTTLEELGDQQRKRVYVSLYQTHLPKLDSLGIIDWSESDDDHTIAATPATRVTADILDDSVAALGGGR